MTLRRDKRRELLGYIPAVSAHPACNSALLALICDLYEHIEKLERQRDESKEKQ